MSNDKFEAKVRAQLQDWQPELPPNVAGRLRAARRTAIAYAPTQRKLSPVKLAMLSTACVAMVAVGVVTMNREQDKEQIRMEDMVMLSTGDEFELFDDIEFLLWLESQGDVDLG